MWPAGFRLRLTRTHTGAMEMKNVRWQLDLLEDRAEHLKCLIEECELDTQKELINSALTLFEWAVGENRLGRSIASIDEQTMQYKELAMPALLRVKMRASATDRRPIKIGAT